MQERSVSMPIIPSDRGRIRPPSIEAFGDGPLERGAFGDGPMERSALVDPGEYKNIPSRCLEYGPNAVELGPPRLKSLETAVWGALVPELR